MSSNLKEQAVELLKQAIHEDEAGNYRNAFLLYMNALEYFKTHLNYEKNSKHRKKIAKISTKYGRRAEEIRAVLDAGKTTPADRHMVSNHKRVSVKNPLGVIKKLLSTTISKFLPCAFVGERGVDDDERRIGQLLITRREIARGSNGTVILEGIHNGRRVAVKRLVRTHHDVADKEIQNLILCDQHPNVVRWYGVEYDQDFIYLSLERCACSLNDLIQAYSAYSSNPTFNSSVNEYHVGLASAVAPGRDIELWKENGYPSLHLLKLMRDVVCGLEHLHELGIIHRDLKPQNVLIIKNRSLCAKLSDMGISKRLTEDMTSLGHNPTGVGSSGWQAPEQLLHGRQTRAVDLFSLGCVLFFCFTGGRHPFGDHIERDRNIVKNKMDLSLVEHIPEAKDLLSQLLNPNPELRPNAKKALHHPLFWSSEKRLSFLRDTSDRLERERGAKSEFLKALKGVAPVGLGEKWNEKMDDVFINHIRRYRQYKFGSTPDLLRAIRNTLNHYGKIPEEIQEILGPVPEGLDDYFSYRFPTLLIEVYKLVCRYWWEEECFSKYFEDSLL